MGQSLEAEGTGPCLTLECEHIGHHKHVPLQETVLLNNTDYIYPPQSLQMFTEEK